MPTSRSRMSPGSRWRAPLRAGLLIVLAVLAAFAVGASAAPPEGGEEEAGNSLSYPVVWSDGGDAKLPLVGTFGTPKLDGAFVVLPDDPATPEDESAEKWYLQGDPGNLWQAESLDAAAAGIDGVDITKVDWGDNLEAKSWRTDGRVRVETVLYQDVVNDPEFAAVDDEDPGMLAFVMGSLGGEHREEIWGTTNETLFSDEAAVYSGSARLTIQRLEVSRSDPNLPLMKWDASKGEWTGENLVEAPIFNGGVWEGGEGSGYSSEINGSGKVIYGYNWTTAGLEAGHYRITFSLDPVNGPEPLNAAITDETTIAVSEEEGGEESAVAKAAAEPDMGGGVAEIDGANGLSYIDVQLGDPAYGPYVPPVVPTPTPTPASTPPTPSAGQDQTQQPQTQTVRKRVRMTLHARVLSRQRVRFYGSVMPRHDGRKVRIQRRIGDRYRTVATARLRKASSSRSQYRLTLRNAKAGRYRLYMQGDEEHLATTSAVVRVRLR